MLPRTRLARLILLALLAGAAAAFVAELLRPKRIKSGYLPIVEPPGQGPG